MITIEDLKNGLRQEICYDHTETWHVPCFLNDDRSITIEMSLATTDEQMAYSFEPFYVYKLTGHFKCVVPPSVEQFYKNHGNGD